MVREKAMLRLTSKKVSVQSLGSMITGPVMRKNDIMGACGAAKLLTSWQLETKGKQEVEASNIC